MSSISGESKIENENLNRLEEVFKNQYDGYTYYKNNVYNKM